MAWIVYMCTVLAGVCFGGWPQLLRPYGVGSGWTAVFIGAASLFSGVVALKVFEGSTPMPSARAIVFGIMAGLVNGAGTLFFGQVNKSVDAAVLVPITMILIPASNVLAGWLMYGDPMPWNKWAGLAASALAIYLFNK